MTSNRKDPPGNESFLFNKEDPQGDESPSRPAVTSIRAPQPPKQSRKIKSPFRTKTNHMKSLTRNSETETETETDQYDDNETPTARCSSHRMRHFAIAMVVSCLIVLARLTTQSRGRSLQPLLLRSGSSKNKDTNNRRAVAAVELPRNPHATLDSDVVSIHYIPHESRLLVALKVGAQCPRPYLIGRLSGPALVKLDWSWLSLDSSSSDSSSYWNETIAAIQKTSNVTANTIMEGTFQAPIAGEYFLEINALYCDNFFYDLKGLDKITFDKHQNGNNARIWANNVTLPQSHALRYNFRGICMEDPVHQRLTKDATTIIVDHSEVFSQVIGHWSISNNDDIIEWNTTEPVYTRYQPWECYFRVVQHQPLPPECNKPTSPWRFDPYDFQWTEPSLVGLNTSSLKQDKPTVICVMGHSHSRVLREASQRLSMTLEKINVTVEWTPAQYPNEVTPGLVFRYIQEKKCNKIVIAVGQWPASWVGNSPTLLYTYYQSIKVMFQNLLQSPPIMMSQVDIYARSIHYNSLSYKTSTCPPQDWRNPLVIDGYNSVIKAVTRELNISFLDTNFLVGPVWDAAPDFCHLNDKTSDAEMLYIAASVLRDAGRERLENVSLLQSTIQSTDSQQSEEVSIPFEEKDVSQPTGPSAIEVIQPEKLKEKYLEAKVRRKENKHAIKEFKKMQREQMKKEREHQAS